MKLEERIKLKTQIYFKRICNYHSEGYKCGSEKKIFFRWKFYKIKI